MAAVTKKMSPKEIEALYNRIKHQALKESKPDYTCWSIKLSECTITAYQSGKVVFQGKDLSWLEDEKNQKPDGEKEQKTKPAVLKGIFPQAGSDEVGTGDYFGPVCVAACIVPDEAAAKKLEALGITDSKAMSDPLIRKIAPIIKELCPYSICVLSNAKYNEIHKRANINAIKAMLHNQVYLNLKKKGASLPQLSVVDQFAAEKTYYAHLKKQGAEEIYTNLHFETKAESKYLAVACASVLARNAFLETWDNMEKAYDFHFEKGASAKVDVCGKKFLQEHSISDLNKVAKIHFANTEKILKHHQ